MRNNFTDLASQWQWDTPRIEEGTRTIEVGMVFDHDYQMHVLFLEWDTSISPQLLGYTLYFYGIEPIAIPVAHWENKDNQLIPPYVKCATLVEEWRTLYCGMND